MRGYWFITPPSDIWWSLHLPCSENSSIEIQCIYLFPRLRKVCHLTQEFSNAELPEHSWSAVVFLCVFYFQSQNIVHFYWQIRQECNYPSIVKCSHFTVTQRFTLVAKNMWMQVTVANTCTVTSQWNRKLFLWQWEKNVTSSNHAWCDFVWKLRWLLLWFFFLGYGTHRFRVVGVPN